MFFHCWQVYQQETCIPILLNVYVSTFVPVLPVCSAGQPRWSIWENPKGTRNWVFPRVFYPGCGIISEIVSDQQIILSFYKLKEWNILIICGSDHMCECTAPHMSSPASIERLLVTMATRAQRTTCTSRRSSDVMQLSVSPSGGALVPAAAAPQVVTTK